MPALERDGVSIHFEVTDGHGPPLLMLHGQMGTSETWSIEGYLEDLAADFRVITPDLRGHGQSDAPHDPAAYSLTEFVADQVAVLDSAGAASAYVCGFSLGAVVALALAGRHPERVAGLVALDGASCNSGFEDVRWEPPDEDWIQLFEAEGMSWATKACDEQGRPGWSRMLGLADPEAMVAICRADAFDCRVEGSRLRDLAMPLVCVWGERNPYLERALALPLPAQAQVVVIPGADHVGVIEHREIVAPLVRSLVPAVALAS